MRSLKLLTMVFGFAITALGVWGLVAPAALLAFARTLMTTEALYLVAAGRVIIGALLLLVAPVARTPRTLRVLGTVIVIVGVATPFFGVERSRVMLDWWVAQGASMTQTVASVAICLGLFLLYTLSTSRSK